MIIAPIEAVKATVERNARAEDQAREDAAAKAVGAEQEHCIAAVRPGRWRRDRQQVLLVRVVGRDPGREDGADRQDGDDDKADLNAAGSQPEWKMSHGQRAVSFGLRMR